MIEEWREIKGFEGLYEVSNLARVRKLKRWKGIFGHLMRICSGPNGYLQVGLRKNGVRKHAYLHILVAEAFVPNPDDLPEVNHDDGDKKHCLPNNLLWVDRSGNNAHKNRTLKSHHNQKDFHFIDPDGINRSTGNLTEFCDIYSLTRSAMSEVYSGKRYQHKGWRCDENVRRMAEARARASGDR